MIQISVFTGGFTLMGFVEVSVTIVLSILEIAFLIPYQSRYQIKWKGAGIIAGNKKIKSAKVTFGIIFFFETFGESLDLVAETLFE